MPRIRLLVRVASLPGTTVCSIKPVCAEAGQSMAVVSRQGSVLGDSLLPTGRLGP